MEMTKPVSCRKQLVRQTYPNPNIISGTLIHNIANNEYKRTSARARAAIRQLMVSQIIFELQWHRMLQPCYPYVIRTIHGCLRICKFCTHYPVPCYFNLTLLDRVVNKCCDFLQVQLTAQKKPCTRMQRCLQQG